MKLTELYKLACDTPSDINEHLPVLMDHASDCQSVVEIGARWGLSAIAFLMANPEKLVSIDCDPNAIFFCLCKFMDNQARPGEPARSLCGRVRYQPRVASSLDCEIEECDLLFIDSLHTYHQLSEELKRHGNKAQRYLIFHDTVSFGHRGEDGSKPGLIAAIREFQEANGTRWNCVLNCKNQNGLVVLQRKPFAESGSYPGMFLGTSYTPNPVRTD